MGNAFHFGYVEEHLYVFRETFTGNGAATTFQLTSNVGNATFETGSWTVVNVETAMAADASKTTGAALYDSLLPLVRHKITVSSISATGLVTLNYAPMAENFYIWYWYDMEGDAIQDYYRDDYVSSMEADAGVTVASGITVDVVGFAGLLDSNDNTVQKALDSLDDLTISSDNGVVGTVTAGNIKINTPQSIATGASPEFVTVKLTNLTDDYIPYHVNDATGLANGPTKTNVDSAVSLKHAAITLDTNADTLLSLSTQALGLDTQTANYALMGPVSGAAAVPTFRSPQSNEVIVPGGIGTPAYDDMQDFLRMTRSAGRFTGGVVSAHAGPNGTVDISEMEGMIFTTNALGGDYIYFKQAAATGGLALTDLSVSWVYFDWNGGTPRYLATVTRSTINEYNQFTVGRVWRSGNNVEVLTTGHSLYNKDRRAHNRLIKKYGTMDRESGAVLTAHGTALRLTCTPGVWWVANTTYTKPVAAAETFHVLYKTGGSATWVESAETTLFSDVFDGGTSTVYTCYQNGNSLGSLGANKYGVYWVYMCPEGELYVLLGTATYANVGAAQAATVPSTLPPYLVDWSRLIGRVICQNSAAAFYSVESAFNVSFALSATVDHGSLGGLTDDDHTQYPLGAAAGAAGQIVTYGGAARTLAWTTATYPATTTVYRLLVSTAANTVGELAAGGATGGYLAGKTGDIPAWETLNQAAVAGLTTSDSPTFNSITSSNSLYVGQAATEGGHVTIYGGSAGEHGGGIILYTEAAMTGTANYYHINLPIATADLQIGSSNDLNALVLTSGSDLFLTDGDMHIQKGGTTKIFLDATNETIFVGVDDTTVGTVSIYGGGAGAEGGVLKLFLGTDDAASIAYWGVQIVEDDLVIGPDTDPDALKLVAAKDLYLTDGNLNLQISGTTCISLVSTANYGGITVGVVDSRYGYIGLYGAGAGSSQGGVLDLHCAADYDTAIDYYRIYTNNDMLYIGPNTEMNAIVYNASKILTLLSGSISLTAGSMYAKTNYGANRAASSYVNFYSNTNGSGTSYYPIVSYKSDTTTACFYVRDDGYGYLYDTAWHYGPCSETLKENIRDLKAETPDIRAVMRGIVPKRFDYKESFKETNRLNKVGYIAEQLELVMPGIIDYNTTVPGHPEPHMTFDRDLIIPYMVLGIHDVMDETDRLNLITDGLKAQIAALEEELKKLKKGAEL